MEATNAFPQRLGKATLEARFKSSWRCSRSFTLIFLFLDAISEMPSYAKFLKDMQREKVSRKCYD